MCDKEPGLPGPGSLFFSDFRSWACGQPTMQAEGQADFEKASVVFPGEINALSVLGFDLLGLGENDKVFKWLEKAYVDRSIKKFHLPTIKLDQTSIRCAWT